MLTTAFSFFQFCDCKNSVFVIHSQFLFSNFDEERVANTKNEKCNWLWKTRQKSTVSIMLRNHFFAEFFCYWGFVIHSQLHFSNFDEERVANAKNEKCNWLWITFFDFSKDFYDSRNMRQRFTSQFYQNTENNFVCKYVCKSIVRLKMQFSR